MKDLQQKACKTEQANLGGKLEILSESKRGQAMGIYQRRSRAEDATEVLDASLICYP